MRVTPNLQIREAIDRIDFQKARQLQFQRQLSTGVRISFHSDAPADASILANLDTEKSVALARQKSIDALESGLNVAESSLERATELAVAAKELALAGANDTLSAADRGVIAQQIRSIAAEMLAIANTQSEGEFIFAGSATNQAAFDSAGVYQGDAFERSVVVDVNHSIQANIAGDRVFAPGSGVDAFAELEQLAVDLEANDSVAVRARLGALDTVHEQIVVARSELGGRLQALERGRENVEDRLVAIEQLRASIAGADLEEASVQLASSQTALEATFLSIRTLLETAESGLNLLP